MALALAGQKMPEEVRIENIDASDMGETVLVEGRILDVSSTGSTAFLTVSDGTGNISVVAFERSGFSEDQQIRFSGRVTLYEGKLKIIAREFYLDGRGNSGLEFLKGLYE
ncbi:MAG: OB-fold nucleic acid binding domain-containing protein [Candidatus Nanosalina sp.]